MHRLPVAISRVPTCFSQDLKAIVMRTVGYRLCFLRDTCALDSCATEDGRGGANTEACTQTSGDTRCDPPANICTGGGNRIAICLARLTASELRRGKADRSLDSRLSGLRGGRRWPQRGALEAFAVPHPSSTPSEPIVQRWAFKILTMGWRGRHRPFS